MNGELTNPQDIISAFPYTWFCVLALILGALNIPGFPKPFVRFCRMTLWIAIFACVYLFVLELRALFPDQPLLEEISGLLLLVAVTWCMMWIVWFAIKKPNP